MVTFRIEDMTCGHCAGTIARAVAGVDRDARIEVNIAEKLVRVSGSASEAELQEAIADAGYAARKAEAAPAPGRGAGGACCCGIRKQAVDAHQSAPDGGGACCK